MKDEREHSELKFIFYSFRSMFHMDDPRGSRGQYGRAPPMPGGRYVTLFYYIKLKTFCVGISTMCDC
jgi:hypothetical protein